MNCNGVYGWMLTMYDDDGLWRMLMMANEDG